MTIKRKNRNWNNQVGLLSLVVCEVCGKTIEEPLPRQRACSYNKLEGRTECQIELNRRRANARNKKHRREKLEEETEFSQMGMKTPGSNGKPDSQYKMPDDEGPMHIGRPTGAASQKGIRGKYSNGKDRKLRECLGLLCTEEGKGRKFLSSGPFHRICPKCEPSKLGRLGREAKVAGHNNTCNVETQVLRWC
jgi:hypothetical protein